MRLLALLGIFLIAGCSVGPNYKQPDISVPASYKATTQTSAQLSTPIAKSVDLSRWWLEFHDPELESLIARALAQNLDLLTAESRVREAREQEIVAGAAGLPQVNAIGSGVDLHSNSNFGQNLGFGQPAPGSSSSSSSAPVSKGGSSIKLYSAGFDATWEIDLFGQVRRSVEAARAGTEAALWQMRDGQVSLTAEIASDYASLRADQSRLAILDSLETDQRNTLNLIIGQHRAGFVTELSVYQQQQLLTSTLAQRPPLLADGLVQRHAIALLLGEAPDALDKELESRASEPPIPPSLPVGLPSDLLRARPDVRAAERQLAEATANVGVAIANLYPKFDLLGGIVFSGTHISNLLSSSNLAEAAVGSLSWPIFHGDQIHANIRAKQDEETQAYYAYKKAVLAAVQNVEDALVRYEAEQQRFVALDRATKLARASTQLAVRQYEVGLVNYTNVLQAQSTQLSDEDDLAQSRASLTSDLIAVFKALGGGWNEDQSSNLHEQANRLFEQ